MPPPAPAPDPLAAMASVIVASVLAAMLLAWLWALSRLASGRALLPTSRPRVVPWGAGSILLLLLAWFLTLNFVSMVHYGLTGRSGKANELVTADAGEATGERADEADDEAPPPWTELDILLITDAVALMLIPQIVLVLRRTSAARPLDLGLTARDFSLNVVRGAVACLLLAPVCYGLIFLLSWIWTPEPHDLQTLIQDRFSVGTAVLAILSAVVIAPAVEELAFRGVVLPWFEGLFAGLRGGERSSRAEDPWAGPVGEPSGISTAPADPPPSAGPLDSPDGLSGASEEAEVWPAPSGEPPASPAWSPAPLPGAEARWMANIVTSAIFASLHAPQWPAPVPLFVLSLGLGLLIQRTGSLVAPIALHATFNGLATTALILSQLAGDALPAEEVEKAVPPPAVVLREATSLGWPVHRGDSHLFRRMNLGEDEFECYRWDPRR